MIGRRVRAFGLTALVLTIGLVSLAPPAHSQDGPVDGDPSEGGRVLVVSVPGVTWQDVADHDLPALQGLFEGAALSGLAPRSVARRSGPGDAYLTISAGARTTTSRSVDGQVLALDEQSSGSDAGEIFLRRTGVAPHGRYVSLAWPQLVRLNDRQHYDAALGLLASTLEAEGVASSAIGNADGTDGLGRSYQRQVGLAAADRAGVVSDGSLGEDLLLSDPARPFGVRFDQPRVLEEFQRLWSEGPDRNVVFVEASDLARTMRYRLMVDGARYDTLWEQALTEADQLVARLLAEVDLARDTVLVVAPYNLPGESDLTALALHDPDERAGYLRSGSTQRAGFLTLVDVAPTILDSLGLSRPVDMEGRPAVVTPSTDSLEDRVDRLVTLNEVSRFRERLLVPTTALAVVGLALVTAATVVLQVSGRMRRWRSPLRSGALAVLSILPLSFLARWFPLEDLGMGFYWAFLVAGAGLVAGAAGAIGRVLHRRDLDLLIVLTLALVVPAADVMTGSHLSLGAAFGYAPTASSRLYGIGNYAFGQVAAAACLLAAFTAGRGPRPRWRALAIALLVATLVVLGVPRWGSDVGGVLAFTPAIALFGVLQWNRRIRPGTVVAAAGATLAATIAFGFVDLARPPEDRAHLGRLFERIGEEGAGPLISMVERKLVASLEASAASLWVAAIPIAVGLWAYLVRGPGRPVVALRAATPTLQAGLAAGAAAAVLGALVNDSGAIVAGVAALVLTTSLLVLLLAAPDEPPGAEAA